MYPLTPLKGNTTRRNKSRGPYPNLPAIPNNEENNSNSTLTLSNGAGSGTSTPLSTKKRGITWRNQSRKNASLTNVRFNRKNPENIKYRKSVQGSTPIFPREPLNAKLAALYANISSKYNNTNTIVTEIEKIPGLSKANQKKLVRAHYFYFPPVESLNELTFELERLLEYYYGYKTASQIFLRLF